MRSPRRSLLLLALPSLQILCGQALGEGKALPLHKPGEVLVQFRADLSLEAVRSRIAPLKAEPVRRFRIASRPASPLNRTYVLKLEEGSSVLGAVDLLSRRSDVEFVQPNYLHRKEEAPDDPYFAMQWGLDNTGQPGIRGPLEPRLDADIDWQEAWEKIGATLPLPERVVVGVIDTGVSLTHPDLAAVLWSNPGEIAGNGLDDDGNGYADDVHGWDFAYDDPDPTDGDGHGTHVSGTIAARTDNGAGVAGVTGSTPEIQIMALKFLDDSGSGYTSDAIDAILYGIDNGAKVLNNSWGGGPYEPALYSAISTANEAGVVFVAAAGNERADTDLSPHYPSSYEVPNVISVAASDRWGGRADFSNWGLASVDLAAPGDEIISTVPGGGYAFWGGTSMATPHVSGVAAILYGLDPAAGPGEIISKITDSTDPRPSYHGRLATHGRLNLNNILESMLGSDTVPPGPVDDLQPVNVGPGQVVLRFTAPGDDGASGSAHRYLLGYEEDASWAGFGDANHVAGGWMPGPPGAFEYLTLSGLDPETDYRIQVKVFDDVGNATLSSETVAVTTSPDPAAFADDMESGPGGWVAESPWSMTTAQAHSPSHCWTDSPSGDYGDKISKSLTSPEMDLSGAGGASLTYWQRYAIETGYDFGYVEARAPGGAWTTIHAVTGTNLVWHRVTLDLNAFAGGVVQVRFRLQTDDYVVADGWYIDDVTVTAAPPHTLIFVDTFDDLSAWTTPPGSGFGIEAGMLTDSPGGNYADDRMDAAALASPLDLSLAARASLSFDLSVDTEEGYDTFFVETSTDGLYWSELQRWTGSHPSKRYAYNLDMLAGYPNVWFRFRSSSDYTINRNGSLVDNLDFGIVPAPDGDADGTPDLLDCAPGDGSAFAPPGEITGVAFLAGGVTFEWDSAAGSTGPGIAYDVLRGGIGDLPVGSPGSETCHEPLSADTQAVDPAEPATGAGFFYLVRGVNVCATGTYGFDSSHAERISPACP